MKYKAGDKVRIKSLDWYNENTNKCGYIMCGCVPFNTDMSVYCGKVLTICNAKEEFSYYQMKECKYVFTDEMIEGLVEEDVDLIPKFGEYSDNDSLDIPTMTTDFIKEYGLPCPEGYIFKDENGNVINATKIVLEKKKKEYPKTYEECCKVLNIAVRDLDILDNMLDTTEIIYSKNLDRHLNSFRKFLICRDAYWKIAGEEMGLGKPWEPDYDSGVDKFGIVYFDNTIMKTCAIARWERHLNKILEFPTAEMRDAFYENFKEEIEICKELL